MDGKLPLAPYLGDHLDGRVEIGWGIALRRPLGIGRCPIQDWSNACRFTFDLRESRRGGTPLGGTRHDGTRHCDGNHGDGENHGPRRPDRRQTAAHRTKGPTSRMPRRTADASCVHVQPERRNVDVNARVHVDALNAVSSANDERAEDRQRAPGGGTTQRGRLRMRRSAPPRRNQPRSPVRRSVRSCRSCRRTPWSKCRHVYRSIDTVVRHHER